MQNHLDWSAYKDAGMGDAYADIPEHGGNFAKAVAVCIRSGQCETYNKGLMCPSFKLTGNPDLSTGGRVRLLKALLSDNPEARIFEDKALQHAMDLCISCKGCKRECDNGVDMSLIKVEYLAQAGKKRDFRLRSAILANTQQWLHYFPALKGLIRLRNSSALVRFLSEGLGFSAQVPLPQPADDPFIAFRDNLKAGVKTHAKQPDLTRNQHDNKSVEKIPREKPKLVLFVDTFSRYFDSEIADAAYDVLVAGGYSVELAQPVKEINEPERPLCCGRTYLAQGQVDKAKAEMRRLCLSLQPHVAAGKTIIGLEASCIPGLRDDAKALGLGEIVDICGRKELLI